METGDEACSEGTVDPANALQRGSYLRKLRQLAEEDEEERVVHDGENSMESTLKTELLDDGSDMLLYGSFLSHQYCYDDLKHVDYKLIDYGCYPISEEDCTNHLVVEQDKGLGTGGLCWDAAFILGEYMEFHRKEWLENDRPSLRLLELGCGTGLAGMMVAKAPSNQHARDNVHISLTDLPNLMPLLGRNLDRNFVPLAGATADESSSKSGRYCTASSSTSSNMTICAHVLDWAEIVSATPDTYNVIIGADIVASLYDPVALARAIHCVAGKDTLIYISFKESLSSIHCTFEGEMERLFDEISFETPSKSCTRNHNPGIRILKASGRVDL